MRISGGITGSPFCGSIGDRECTHKQNSREQKKITKKQQQQQKSAAAKEPWEAQNQFGLVHFDAKAIAL